MIHQRRYSLWAELSTTERVYFLFTQILLMFIFTICGFFSEIVNSYLSKPENWNVL